MGQSIHRFLVGEIECIALLDGMAEDPVSGFLASVNLNTVEPELAKYGLKKDGGLTYPYTCLYINTGKYKVLIDTGLGDLWPSCGHLSDCLSEVGVGPDDIDIVVITHAHGDHIGGNVDKNGKISFPNAQWLISKAEWNFWTDLANLKDLPPHYADYVKKKLLPISELVRLVERELEFVPGVFAIPLPGHTPGHMVIAVRSQDRELLYTSDAMLHPLQVDHPDWCAAHFSDLDWDKVTQSRRELFELAAAKKSLVLAYHFNPFPSLGYIERAEQGWKWVSAIES